MASAGAPPISEMERRGVVWKRGEAILKLASGFSVLADNSATFNEKTWGPTDPIIVNTGVEMVSRPTNGDAFHVVVFETAVSFWARGNGEVVETLEATPPATLIAAPSQKGNLIAVSISGFYASDPDVGLKTEGYISFNGTLHTDDEPLDLFNGRVRVYRPGDRREFVKVDRGFEWALYYYHPDGQWHKIGHKLDPQPQPGTNGRYPPLTPGQAAAKYILIVEGVLVAIGAALHYFDFKLAQEPLIGNTVTTIIGYIALMLAIGSANALPAKIDWMWIDSKWWDPLPARNGEVK